MMSPRLVALLVATGLGVHAADLPPNGASESPTSATVTAGLVQWRNWSADLPAVARTAGKPIYVFAGSRLNELTRATWRQTFARPETADFLNQHFICVQVDTDEQGALATIIRAHLSLLRQADSLPVHLWLNPELQVIEIAAYLPATEEWGKPGFLKVAGGVKDAWQADPANCGAKIAETLAQADEGNSPAPLPTVDTAAVTTALDRAAARWREQADAANGGFGDAPKYAQPELLRFLLGRPSADRDLALATLRRIANSALRDPLDGGFFKYSTDPAWRLPLLQKLLADQARLALAYLEADAVAPDSSLREAARGALDYALARLALPTGGYAFADDGSVDTGHAAFLWSAADLSSALGNDSAGFFTRHHVAAEGNLGDELDPGARWKGLNVLISALPATAADTAELAKIAALRKSRPAPARDERAFAGPQALLLAALSRAAVQLDDKGYRTAADRLYRELHNLVSEGSAPTVRRLKGSAEEACPADLAALAFAFHTYGKTTVSTEATGLAATILRKLTAESLDSGRGTFVVSAPAPKLGFLNYRTPALAEPCEAEALALLAGLGGHDAALVQAGILNRLQNEDPAGTGALLLALATSSSAN